MHRASPHRHNTQTQSQGHPGLHRPPPHHRRPTKAINAPLEHLRGIAQGFINHRNYHLHCLLHPGGFQHPPHPKMRRASKRSTAPTNTAILTIEIRAAQTPRQSPAQSREPAQQGASRHCRGHSRRVGVPPTGCRQRWRRPPRCPANHQTQQTRSHATTRDAINGGTHRRAQPTQRPSVPEGERPQAHPPDADASPATPRTHHAASPRN